MTLLQIKATHVVGFLVWTGMLLSCLQLLLGHHLAGADGQRALSKLERRAGLVMDIAALIAIAAGLYLALGTTPSAFKNGGWLHLKLTAVLALLGVHGYTRVKIRKFRKGDVSPFPVAVYWLTIALIAAIAIIAVLKPLAKFA